VRPPSGGSSSGTFGTCPFPAPNVVGHPCAQPSRLFLFHLLTLLCLPLRVSPLPIPQLYFPQCFHCLIFAARCPLSPVCGVNLFGVRTFPLRLLLVLTWRPIARSPWVTPVWGARTVPLKLGLQTPFWTLRRRFLPFTESAAFPFLFSPAYASFFPLLETGDPMFYDSCVFLLHTRNRPPGRHAGVSWFLPILMVIPSWTVPFSSCTFSAPKSTYSGGLSPEVGPFAVFTIFTWRPFFPFLVTELFSECCISFFDLRRLDPSSGFLNNKKGCVFRFREPTRVFYLFFRQQRRHRNALATRPQKCKRPVFFYRCFSGEPLKRVPRDMSMLCASTRKHSERRWSALFGSVDEKPYHNSRIRYHPHPLSL